MLLTIAIPTYNRSTKLDETLNRLFKFIIDSKFKKEIILFVSNNGSNDDTLDILNKQRIIFENNDIIFKYNSFINNQGFDINVYKCYNECESEYVWLLSDDDIINEGSIDKIFNDIKNYNPNIIYYNFNQRPYTVEKPYILENTFYARFNHNSLKKIINWPKLSTIVLRKFANINRTNNTNLGFAHIELIMKIYYINGNLLLSKYFIGQPQNDYLDNIDFPPYIGNNLNTSLLNTLKNINKLEYFDSLRIPYTDPTISSLNTLGCFYRGKHMLSHNLKKELELEIINNILNLPLRIFFNYKFYYEFSKFIISYLIYINKKIINFLIYKNV
jgi:glycosyltransferase involved in cell wall biosynthesis